MYKFNSRIRYSEIDRNGVLSLQSLLDYFQDCSTFHSEDVGMGTQFLTERNLAWVLNSWQIVVDRFPGLCENVSIGSFAYDFKKFMGFRNFFLEDEQGIKIAWANTVWSLLDTTTMHPARRTPDVMSIYGIEPPLEMDYAPRKIAVPGEGTGQEPIQVKAHHLDTNLHVNNGQYIRIAMDYLKEGFRVWQMRAEYRKSAVLGDIMVPVVVQTNESSIIILEDTAGDPFCITEFKEKEEKHA